MDRKDWALLAIAAAEGDPLGPVQLQKSLFLLGESGLVDSDAGRFYVFSKYNYGPFSQSIYHDAEVLEGEGMVSISRSGSVRQYRASRRGKTRADELKEQADPGAVEYLGRVVKWACSLTFAQLVRSIYAQFPEYRENSVFSG